MTDTQAIIEIIKNKAATAAALVERTVGIERAVHENAVLLYSELLLEIDFLEERQNSRLWKFAKGAFGTHGEIRA